MSQLDEKLRFALPDGHLMNSVLPFLKGTGLTLEGYEKTDLNRRPVLCPLSEEAQQRISRPEKVAVKVIRPQDMPAQVANGNFDIALSGTDWLREHKIRFPNSPVDPEPLLRLGLGKVRIVAAAHQDHGINMNDFLSGFRARKKRRYFRIASEYVYIADDYAQKKNIRPYRIIMTYGATESLIPEDCDLIIENTETGNTLKKNNLSILDTLMESEGCLIVNKESMESSEKKDLIENLRALFKMGLTRGTN